MDGSDMEEVRESLNIVLDYPNFNGTPFRWSSYMLHYTQSYDPQKDLGTTFPPKGTSTFDNAMIVQVGIPYRAVCAHHLLPVLGTAHIGYIPRKRVVGLSKLSRLIYGITHAMPSLQEDVCNEVTAALMIHLVPLGAMCVISAEPSCMTAGGI